LVSPVAAQNIGLALHELATNAVKHGSLSGPRGSIHLTWNNNPPRLHINWSERDGPPVTPPIQSGFGHAVLSRLAPEALDGEAVLAFDAEGFSWKLEIPATYVL
jgi:two-component sensor histidine kinase